MDRYDAQTVETKWQRIWDESRAFEVPNPKPGAPRNERKSYVLEMLPYPSGTLHIGHVLVYTLGDVLAHFYRRTGSEVLRPMGYDSFGLPAENAALKEGEHPRDIVERNIVSIRRTMKRLGWAIDWSREFSTHQPEYYRWTQWLFLKFFEAGHTYRKAALVNWCPNDQTVLANEQVKNGRCERCGFEVEARKLDQWFFRITAYADSLIDEMKELDWPERVLAMQRNWIGRSEGAEILFRVDELDIDIPVFTTRPDTLFGATFFVLAPEHPLVDRLAEQSPNGDEIRAYVRKAGARPAAGAGRGNQDRSLHRLLRDEPGQRRPDSDLGRGLRPDGLRHRRDHGRARARRSRRGVCGAVRPAHQGRRRRRREARRLGAVLGPAARRGGEGDRRVAGQPGARTACGELPPARLGLLPPAVLGLSDSDRLLRRLRDRSRAGGRAAGDPAGGRGLQAEGNPAAGAGRGLGSRSVSRAAARKDAARSRRWTPSSIRRGTSCATAIRTTTRRRTTARSPTTGCRSTTTPAASTTRRCT